GFGDDGQEQEACDLSIGLSTVGGDCDDGDPQKNPIASEECDEIDNNCNGEIDEGVTDTFYLDEDEDGFGSDENTVIACSAPEGYIVQGGDCDDIESYAHPLAIEFCDEIDNDCNGLIDDDPVGNMTYYTDSDGDGFGDETTMTQGCSLPQGHVLQAGDCEDQEPLVNPSMVEICDDIDNNCNDETDEEAVDLLTYYTDSDEDGFGDETTMTQGCSLPDGHVLQAGDCEDQEPLANPSMVEICDDIDNNCNDEIDDEAVDRIELYIDEDLDGFGTNDSMFLSCEALEGYVQAGGDCDDSSASISPDQPELCFDETDNNCDDAIDDASSVDASEWYLDFDDDSFGDENDSITACEQPENHVSDNTDCDDENDAVYPNADEFCNDIDDNCDDLIDEDTALDAPVWYLDFDDDGFGDENDSITACEQPENYVSDNTDCNDEDADFTEVCYLGSCAEILDADPAAASGTYTIDVDETYFDVYCDMENDDGGWTAIAKQINDQSCDFNTPKDPLTTVSDLSDGHALWLVPETLAQVANELLFYDIPTGRWAVAELTTEGRSFLSMESFDAVQFNPSGTPLIVNMPIVRDSGYRTCGYNTIDHAAHGYMFDFADGYGWHGTGFSVCRTTTPESLYGAFYDSPLINPETASYSCTSDTSYYYISAGVVFYLR
ncbi:MAG: hypothetical protein CMK59_05005, partial [Proteobacteria bacterium]|nr:hypothetical protein [Pseudomonadota bacterium]